jgi:hypothetical protein
MNEWLKPYVEKMVGNYQYGLSTIDFVGRSAKAG